MVTENPQEPPLVPASSKLESHRVFYWRIPFLIFAAVVASIPFYGFFVHAARDSQETALWIILCWLMTWLFAIGSIVTAVVRPPASQSIRLISIFMIMYLLFAGLFGWGGVGNAIRELLAG